MTATRTVVLYLVRETELARLYSPRPFNAEARPNERDCVWLPRSQIEHTRKMGSRHEVTIPEWLADKKGL